MIELPGSFSGIVISPIPQRGPLASQRMSLAIFSRRHRQASLGGADVDQRVVGREGRELVGRRDERMARSPAAIWAAAVSPNSGWALRPVPTAVPPIASS